VSFASPFWLLGTLVALVVAGVLLWGSVGLRRAVRRFGEPERVYALQTSDPSKRRAYKGLLLVLATALAFVAAARPQYGKGTRLIPATNIDCVIVLDYSKSMYAQDVQPSRIFRAKVEVSRLVKELPGARFGAVAFAGEPMGLPLSADGSAIAQFFRQLDPNDMPVGGTAIARALDHADNLLKRDPKSADHKRIILLVTDGEDLEGDPVTVARSIGSGGTTIHVVQIGGRTPERIPEVGPDGKILGYRTDHNGKPLLTALTVDGEKQLGDIAAATPDGQIIRAEHGTTGIEKVAAQIRAQMKGELAERVETVYADVYFYPLGLAILLLVIEVFVGESPFRRFVPRRAPAHLTGGASSAPAQLGGLPTFLLAPSEGAVSDKPKKPSFLLEKTVEKAVLSSRGKASSRGEKASSRRERESDREDDSPEEEGSRGKKR